VNNYSNVDKITLEQIKKILNTKGILDIQIVTDSMAPIVRVGGKYQIRRIEKNLKKFDIIVFRREKKLIAHYVWRVNNLKEKTITTRSLKVPNLDELPIQEADIVGILDNVEIGLLTKLKLRLIYA
jgi:hypothetical protein